MTGVTMGIEGWALVVGWAAAMLLAVVLLVREPRHTVADDAAAILRARFARGEITEDEYRHAASILDADADPVPRVASARGHRTDSGQEAHHD